MPGRIIGIPPARGAAQEFSRLVPQHLLKVMVAARQAPLAQENNAHHGAVKQQLLFAHGSVQGRLGALVLVDVVHDPDGAFRRVLRIDEPPCEAGPEQRAIAALQLALLPEGLALRKHRVSTAPQRLEGIPVGVKSFAADADQGLGAGITEYFCVPVIAAHNAALAQKHDAHPGTVQQDLLFAQSALQGGVGSRGGTLQF